jgi:tetratricopeptide (TPR) repeat protein
MDGMFLIVEVDGWARGDVPERIRLQACLTEVVETAFRRSGLAAGAPDHGYGVDGMYLLLPDGRTAPTGLPSLIRELTAAVAESNRQAAASRLRLRLTLSTGLVLPPGIAGRAMAEGLRLVTNESLRAALRRMPPSDLAVVVSDSFYRVTVGRGLLALRPDQCRPVLLGTAFPSTAWVHLPGEAAPAAPSEGGTSAPTRGSPNREMIGQAARSIGRGDHRRAIHLLEKVLDLPADPDVPGVEEALLLFGDCHRNLGELETAAQAWLFLLTRRPLSPEAYHRLGRLELDRRRFDLSALYLHEGLRLLREDPALSAAPGPAACAILLDISLIEELKDNSPESDRCLNEAAEADPLSPLPLVALAYRAARRGDKETARRLFGTALARVPTNNRKGFLDRQSRKYTTLPGGAAIMEVLLENGLDPAVRQRMINAARLPRA